MNYTSMAIERMINLACDYGLINDYRLSPASIEIRHRIGTVRLNPEEARFYLRGLLFGYDKGKIRRK